MNPEVKGKMVVYLRYSPYVVNCVMVFTAVGFRLITNKKRNYYCREDILIT
jgi:hypothetical protein